MQNNCPNSLYYLLVPTVLSLQSYFLDCCFLLPSQWCSFINFAWDRRDLLICIESQYWSNLHLENYLSTQVPRKRWMRARICTKSLYSQKPQQHSVVFMKLIMLQGRVFDSQLQWLFSGCSHSISHIIFPFFFNGFGPHPAVLKLLLLWTQI